MFYRFEDDHIYIYICYPYAYIIIYINEYTLVKMNMYMVHMKVQLKFACVQMCRGYIRMTEIPLKCKGHKIVWKEGTSQRRL